MPFSAVDAIAPAFEHTKRQLLQPFRFGQWIRLSLVGLLAGELSGGGCNVPSIPNFNPPRHPGTEHFFPHGLAGVDPMLYAGLITVLLVAGFVLTIVFMYISSVMRFILFDSVLTKECHIRQGWIERQGPGWRLFLWKLLYALVTAAVLIVVIGIPAAFAYALGWFNQPEHHVVPLVLSGILLFFVVLLSVVAMAVIYVFTKDFVVPQMALENIGAVEGWRRLWAMMKAEQAGFAGYAAYVGLKIVMSIGAAILIGIVGSILGLIILIPVAGVAIAAVLAGKSAGLGWTPYTITLAIVVGCVLLAVFLFLTALISVPAIIFFPAYSMYFFAARYPRLSVALYPAPPVPVPPKIPPQAVPPPVEPPTLPPAPEPAG